MLPTLANLLIPELKVGYETALVLRFITGLGIAGVYPPGIKLVATWFREDRGFGIRILVDALTVGAALPGLLNALPNTAGMPSWQDVLYLACTLSCIGASAIVWRCKPGPCPAGNATFDDMPSMPAGTTLPGSPTSAIWVTCGGVVCRLGLGTLVLDRQLPQARRLASGNR